MRFLLTKRIWSLSALVAIALVIAGALIWHFSGTMKKSPGKLLQVRIAFPVTMSSALPILAYESGHWRSAGLSIELFTLGTGADCIRELEAGRVDLAVAYDTPVANSILRGTKIRVLSELHTASVNTVMIYRKDLGIENPEDLKNRRIGIISGTNAEYFMELFLRASALKRSDVEIVETSFETQVNEIAEGTTEASVLWEPRVSALLSEYPDRYAAFDLPFYSEISMISTVADYSQKNPQVLERVLIGIAAAQKQIQQDPDGAKKIVRQFLGSRGLEVSDSAWAKLRFRMGLGNFLLTTLREQIRLKLKRNQMPGTVPADIEFPDVTEYIESQPMKKVVPGWVSTL